jgi:hypothetical protein
MLDMPVTGRPGKRYALDKVGQAEKLERLGVRT